uniref:Uncharacterized protein LOC114340750 n=1 Tax=Diabrotica virgifera virgifera TaxID=50390 RepID=A0A6P7GU08_DIAVI
MNEIKIEGNDYMAPFKKSEFILRNKAETYGTKVNSLIDVWKSFCTITEKPYDIQQVLEILDWAKLHTLEIVLTPVWKSHEDVYKEQLLSYIDQSEKNLCRKSEVLGQRCRQLLDVAKDPWDDPVLNRLMKEDITIGPAEIAFFCKESAYLISVRISKLCESNCNDFALRLVTYFMECHKKEKNLKIL